MAYPHSRVPTSTTFPKNEEKTVKDTLQLRETKQVYITTNKHLKRMMGLNSALWSFPHKWWQQAASCNCYICMDNFINHDLGTSLIKATSPLPLEGESKCLLSCSVSSLSVCSCGVVVEADPLPSSSE